jgi:hypothetical protein
MKERMKTVGVALVLCLNIGVDPPDVVKASPCARLECWTDPTSLPTQKALEAVAKRMQDQYERWQPRARYKHCLDPTVDDVKKLCSQLRRTAKDERVLFHYNGHGVPRPTANGEIWVFNKNFTQYIPLSIYNLQTWMGVPSIYVLDCSAAATIIHHFQQFAEQREHEVQPPSTPGTEGGPRRVGSFKECILLGACESHQILPQNPELPADLFTACLTTPIKIALHWFASRSRLTEISADLIDRIPGRLDNRKTLLGELNWIFTAITDTIAWNALPRDLFQKLFRQDLLVASLFRNFLLAERIMRSLDCSPVSLPKLPPTAQHAMWKAWDLAAEVCLAQVPELLAVSRHLLPTARARALARDLSVPFTLFTQHAAPCEVRRGGLLRLSAPITLACNPLHGWDSLLWVAVQNPQAEFSHSPFFSEQARSPTLCGHTCSGQVSTTHFTPCVDVRAQLCVIGLWLHCVCERPCKGCASVYGSAEYAFTATFMRSRISQQRAAAPDGIASAAHCIRSLARAWLREEEATGAATDSSASPS